VREQLRPGGAFLLLCLQIGDSPVGPGFSTYERKPAAPQAENCEPLSDLLLRGVTDETVGHACQRERQFRTDAVLLYMGLQIRDQLRQERIGEERKNTQVREPVDEPDVVLIPKGELLLEQMLDYGKSPMGESFHVPQIQGSIALWGKPFPYFRDLVDDFPNKGDLRRGVGFQHSFALGDACEVSGICQTRSGKPVEGLK
jgi:hypothetical protein